MLSSIKCIFVKTRLGKSGRLEYPGLRWRIMEYECRMDRCRGHYAILKESKRLLFAFHSASVDPETLPLSLWLISHLSALYLVTGGCCHCLPPSELPGDCCSSIYSRYKDKGVDALICSGVLWHRAMFLLKEPRFRSKLTRGSRQSAICFDILYFCISCTNPEQHRTCTCTHAVVITSVSLTGSS